MKNDIKVTVRITNTYTNVYWKKHQIFNGIKQERINIIF